MQEIKDLHWTVEDAHTKGYTFQQFIEEARKCWREMLQEELLDLDRKEK